MPEEITTARLRLRPLQFTDLSRYQASITDPQVARPAGLAAPLTPAHVAAGLRADMRQPVAYALTAKTDGRFLGMIVGYTHSDVMGEPTTTAVDLGYFLAPNEWGQGLMPEALRGLLLALRQANSPITTFWATSQATNKRSQGVLVKLAFALIDDHVMAPSAGNLTLERHFLYCYQQPKS